MTVYDDVTFRVRRATAATAQANNVTLDSGEIGLETDTGKFKFGDGETAWNSLPYSTDLTRLPAAVVVDSTLIDLSRPWSDGTTEFSAITPGTDITATLQAAFDCIATNDANGGTIRISTPGTYLLNGALQTGTFTSGSSSYSYAGQILIPAVSQADTMTICLEGATPASSGDSNTGGPSGVILQSNATSGYVIDCKPAFALFDSPATGQPCCWTGVTPRLRNLTVLTPDNPTCGGLNFFCTQRMQLERVYLQNLTFNISRSGAGSLGGLVCPQVNNNGDLVLRDSFIRGFPVGVVLSEHLRVQNSLISGCGTAFGCSGTGHANDLGNIDIEECSTVFTGAAYTGINGTPNTAPGTMVTGAVDFENISATGTGLQPGPFVSDTAAGAIQGQLKIWFEGTYTLPTDGGAFLDLIPLSVAPSSAPNYRDGWMSTHPYDNFGRVSEISGVGAPGQCSPSLHPWRVDTTQNADSSFQILGANSGVLMGLSNPSYCFVPALKGGVSRVISATFTLGTAGHIQVIGQSSFASFADGSNDPTRAINLDCQVGAAPTLLIDNQSILDLAGSALTAGSEHTVDLEILYGWQSAPAVQQAQYPVFVRCYLDGVLGGQAALTADDAVIGYDTQPYDAPLWEDGLAFMDTVSSVSLFRVRDAVMDPRIMHTRAATATWQAWNLETTVCTGTFTLTLPAPVMDAPNIVVNTGSGTVTVRPKSGTLTDLTGTTGNLSVAAGTSVQITSLDGTNYQQVA